MNDEHMLDELKSLFGIEFTAADVRGYCASRDVSYPTVTKRLEPYKVSRGKWNLQITPQNIEQMERAYQNSSEITDNLIPEKDSNFIRFGNFADIRKIIESRLFYPTFITGLSGNGKTMSVEQACAQLGREMIRVNITIETDETDLIGSYGLIGGETVWKDGPVIEAMKRGAILLLDETDLASNKIMCLQPVLEGKGIYLKKVNRFVSPAPGFNIFATANTKGKGSDDGRFIGTNVLNSAFLDRFAITLEQDYPTTATEIKILNSVARSIGLSDADNFIKTLCDWSNSVRKTFFDGGVDEVISTRRLVHILKAYSIFRNKMKAIKYSISGFDDDTKTAFLELYDKYDAEFNLDETSEGVDMTFNL